MNVKQSWTKIPLKNLIVTSFAISFIVAILIVLLNKQIPPQVPLFYGLPTGEYQLTSTWGLLIAPLVSIFVNILNVAICFRVSDIYYQKSLIIASLLVSILTSITVVKIIFLVGAF